ncbi:MAG: malate dehydrogenase [Acidobacteria bacterium]|nr:MAG: malate dehydrogenase [Acidobacteriota bacterium]
MSKRISVAELTRFSVDALTGAGMTPSDAQTVADVLVTTDTWGTFSHGTGALATYIRTMGSGGIARCAKPEVVGEGTAWAIVDGHCAMGMLSSSLAMNLAIQKAQENTIAWVGVRNGSHFGAAGYYATMAAQRDMVGIAMSNADPNMVIPGARGHVIGNNPISYAVPTGSEHPLMLDIALSAVAAGKIFAMKEQGQSIPPSWLTDADGLPTCEIGEWPQTGSMLPMAGHKGYGIAVLVEVLAGVLTGAGVLSGVKSWVLQPEERSQLGQAFIAINVGAIVPLREFTRRVDHVIQELRQAPKAKGSDRIYVPGEMEWAKREDALKNGIELPDPVYASLERLGQQLGIELQAA